MKPYLEQLNTNAPHIRRGTDPTKLNSQVFVSNSPSQKNRFNNSRISNLEQYNNQKRFTNMNPKPIINEPNSALHSHK